MIKVIGAVCCAAACGLAAGKVLSASEIEKCFDYDDGSVCNVTTVVEISLQTTYTPLTEHSEEVVATVVTSNGENKTLATPLVMTFTTISLLQYEAQTLRLFNGKPYEQYFNSLTCNGGSETFCGYYLTDEGENIEYSEGYCCNCGLGDLFGDDARGGACGFLSTSSAHCMRLGDSWYEGSRMISTSYRYGVQVDLTRSGDEDATSSFTISESVPAVQLDGVTGSVTAFIPGSYYDLTGQIILVPLSAAREPIVGDTLHVPENAVSIDGRECNKIGTSFEAFYGEANRCLMKPGSCLANQIEDLIAEDRQRMAENRSALYINLPETEGVATARRQLLPSTLLFTVEAVTEQISYHLKVSSAKIVGVSIPAWTESTVATVHIVSTGRQRATFTIAVTADIADLPQPTAQVLLEVNESAYIDFYMTTRFPAQYEDEIHLVVVNLYTEEPALIDTFEYNMTLQHFEVDKGAQGGNLEGGTAVQGDVEYTLGDGSDEDDSCTSCPWYNPLCFVGRKCFISAVLMFGITILCIILFIWLGCNGYLSRCLKCMLPKKGAFKREKKETPREGEEDFTPAVAAQPVFPTAFAPMPMHPYFATAPPLPLIPCNPLDPYPAASLPTHKASPNQQTSAGTTDSTPPVVPADHT